ncbi:major facilitator family transporter [Pseudomonas sp. M47T1]|uniref:MFS transporter n=1 Tax=Pseudomonas sp. M47T1 TaxID=1179778 RepID=UPI000260733F|nr:MFS transporter [Pseudomonas sp. M47T1]EIK94140.1 major facilitator family transporter [Pseudomonas sp. M47T1]
MEPTALHNRVDTHESDHSHDSLSSIAPAGVQRQAGALQAIVLVFTTQLPIMGIISIVPIIPLLAQHFSGHPQVALLIPLLIAAPSLCIALLSPLAGFLADKVGRRRLLLIAVFFYALFGFAPFMLNDLLSIIASRFCLGVTEAFIMTIANTLMGDLYHGQPRKKWLAVQSAVGSVSATTLLFVSGMLGNLGWHGPFVLYLLALPVFVCLALFTWEPAPRKAEQVAATSQRFPVRAMLIIGAVTMFCAVLYYVEVLQISSVLHAVGLDSPTRIGFASGIAGIGVPIGALLFSMISSYSVRSHLLAALSLFAVGLYGMGVLPGVAWVVAAAFVAQIACGILIPALLTWSLGNLEFQHRGKGMGFWHTSFFLGQFISPFLITLLGLRLNADLRTSVSILGGVALLAAIVTAALYLKRTRPLQSI